MYNRRFHFIDWSKQFLPATAKDLQFSLFVKLKFVCRREYDWESLGALVSCSPMGWYLNAIICKMLQPYPRKASDGEHFRYCPCWSYWKCNDLGFQIH